MSPEAKPISVTSLAGPPQDPRRTLAGPSQDPRRTLADLASQRFERPGAARNVEDPPESSILIEAHRLHCFRPSTTKHSAGLDDGRKSFPVRGSLAATMSAMARPDHRAHAVRHRLPELNSEAWDSVAHTCAIPHAACPCGRTAITEVWGRIQGPRMTIMVGDDGGTPGARRTRSRRTVAGCKAVAPTAPPGRIPPGPFQSGGNRNNARIAGLPVRRTVRIAAPG